VSNNFDGESKGNADFVKIKGSLKAILAHFFRYIMKTIIFQTLHISNYSFPLSKFLIENSLSRHFSTKLIFPFLRKLFFRSFIKHPIFEAS